MSIVRRPAELRERRAPWQPPRLRHPTMHSGSQGALPAARSTSPEASTRCCNKPRVQQPGTAAHKWTQVRLRLAAELHINERYASATASAVGRSNCCMLACLGDKAAAQPDV
eukprot:scaffold104484_cov25-Tisochrysis_lutea.AAC.1